MSIMASMKSYPYSKYNESRNSYGELTVDTSTTIGTIKMSINIVNQATNDYILYSECDYIGLTKDN